MIDEACIFLLYQLDVEVMSYKGAAEVVEYIINIARALSDKQYRNPATYLDFVKLRFVKPSEMVSVDELRSIEFSSTWMHILQMIPRLSESKAREFMTHYATPAHLMHALAVGSHSGAPLEQRRLMFQDKFEKKKKLNKKLSQLVYQVFTCCDPSFEI